VYSNQVIEYKGPKDDKGRWNGWVDIVYGKGTINEIEYREHVYMIRGKRNGISTRTYPGGKVVEEHYIGGIKISNKKSAGSALVEGSAFSLLQARVPWFLFAFEGFQFEQVEVEHYLDTLETLLDGYTFGPEEFDDYYQQVLDTLRETPYDSIIESNDAWSVAFGFQRMKDDPLRQAVIDRHRSETASTFSLLQTSYPDYLNQMNDQGVNASDLEAFCNAMDDSLGMLTVLDHEDPFFTDSVDSHLFVVLSSFLNTEAKKGAARWRTSLGSEFRGIQLATKKALSILNPSTPAATPTEVAEIALSGMLLSLQDGDYIYQSVYDAYRTGLSLPDLPMAGTEFSSHNTATSVSLNGYVLDDGGATVIARGIAWAEHQTPTVDDHAESSGTGTGSYTVNLEGLTEGKTYYARAYATNSVGTAYGNLISFMAEESAVGIEQGTSSALLLSVFPNPANSMVTVRFQAETGQNLYMTITDLSGRRISNSELGDGVSEPGEWTVDVSGLPAGTYQCILYDRGIPVATRMLMIIH